MYSNVTILRRWDYANGLKNIHKQDFSDVVEVAKSKRVICNLAEIK